MRSLDIAATGMLAQQLNVEVISNNIANVNTTAFKRSRPEFQDLLYQNDRRIGTQSSDAGTYSLDLAIQGLGYFPIELPTGEIAYTRAGSFQLNQNGQIVTADGYILQGPGTVPANATAVTVNASGEVQVTLPNQVNPQSIGQINLDSFINEPGLQAIGNNLFLETQSSGAPQQGIPGLEQFGTILQGFIETSNVNVVSEITNLITAQRAYEMNSRVIETSDQMMSTLSQLR
jgi:flagellar basal-body rod protein FlgG